MGELYTKKKTGPLCTPRASQKPSKKQKASLPFSTPTPRSVAPSLAITPQARFHLPGHHASDAPTNHRLRRIARLVLVVLLELLLEVLRALLRRHTVRQLHVRLGLLLALGLLCGRQLGELLGVGAQVAEHILELRGREKHLGQAAQARVLLNQCAVMSAQQAGLVGLVGELALEPDDVLCRDNVSIPDMWLIVLGQSYPSSCHGMREPTPCSGAASARGCRASCPPRWRGTSHPRPFRIPSLASWGNSRPATS